MMVVLASELHQSIDEVMDWDAGEFFANFWAMEKLLKFKNPEAGK